MKTLGGRQFWGDVHFFRGWRIQQNVLTGHYRLLDRRDVRHAWGSFEKCRQKLAEIRERDALPAMDGEAVILLHGIVRSSKVMTRVGEHLEQAGFTAVPFDYPSTRVDLAACAGYLHRVVQSLEGIERVSFVTHSLGGLVVRQWLKEHGDPRAGRLVMIGTPNRGAELADRLHGWPLFRLVLGPAGQQLISDPAGTIAALPVPTIPFAVIAGARGIPDGYNPLIPGDDDGIVALHSARLEGADDFLAVPVLHSFLPFDERVIAAAARFLTTGSLHESGQRVPITKQSVRSETLPASETESGTPPASETETPAAR